VPLAAREVIQGPGNRHAPSADGPNRLYYSVANWDDSKTNSCIFKAEGSGKVPNKQWKETPTPIICTSYQEQTIYKAPQAMNPTILRTRDGQIDFQNNQNNPNPNDRTPIPTRIRKNDELTLYMGSM